MELKLFTDLIDALGKVAGRLKAIDWNFAESERHFNETQAGIRNHAATWMLAAFAAIAILLKSEDKVNWLVSPGVLVGVVSVMATLGLLVLWINDRLVYQRRLARSIGASRLAVGLSRAFHLQLNPL